MGMPGPFRKSSFSTLGTSTVVARGNPSPHRYKILSDVVVNGFPILELEYAGCTNYEGRKVLMFDRGITVQRLKRQSGIDPHFSDSKTYIHPIARFEPTPRGFGMAVRLAQSLKNHE